MPTAQRTRPSKSKTRAPEKGAPRASVRAGTVERVASEKSKGKKSGGKKDKKRGKKKKARKAKRVFTAKTADRHELYQLAVQSPEEDVRFLARVYKRARGRMPLHFREDFCGTALLASAWIKRGKQYTAEGFDIDSDTLAWGAEHNYEPLGDAASRCTLHVKDVREPSHQRPDVRSAQNFSYFVFKERSELLEYVRSAYEDLADEGVFVLDIYGGPEAIMEMEEVRDIEEGFTYIWDQHRYWPASGDYKTYIHFKFKDGTELKRAFKYEWRFWTLTEVKDVLLDAGFESVETFWEGTDEDGESGNGIYRPSQRGENCDAWVTYLVAYK